MNIRANALVAVAALICLIPAVSSAAIPQFSQDFESLNAADLVALGDDGWVVYGNVFQAGTGNFLYGYGPFPAPNNPAAPAFSNIVLGEGGAEQGAQQLSIFSDYENAAAQSAGNLVEANFYKEFDIDASDVGKVCTFSFQAKRGALVPPSTATAFIKTIDPGNGYATTNLVTESMSAIPTAWGGWTLQLTIDAGLVGQLFQVGFACEATSYNPSSIIYDNVALTTDGGGTSNGIVAYSQDFEALDAGNPDALANDGWLVFASVFSGSGGSFLYSYGPFTAPNNPGAPAFCTIVTGEGGAEQGTQQLSVFSDYENAAAQGAGDLIEANVYQEQTIGSDDIGKTWVFEFQAKRPATGGVTPPTTALAFIKTIDPNSGFSQTNFITVDMSTIGTTWGGYNLSLSIDAGLVGQLFQIGFSSTCTDYNPSSVIYDNVVLREATGVGVPDTTPRLGVTLNQNYPNPFNPLTRIDFSLDRAERVDLAVYDVAGRLVASLVSGDLPAGEHHVTWNGRTDRGTSAASGQYQYVLKTPSGQTSRSMILLK
ncbi:MAG: FlgD immunoglobulin-like domain containing protein [Candidatus Krumholzibacteriia bacterium]